MTDEIWKPIPGYGGHYEASSHGRIRVLDRVVTKFNPQVGRPIEHRRKGHILRQIPYGRPFLGHVRVSIGQNGKNTSPPVHRLVLLAFIGPCPDGMEACHNNGNADDNRPENLRWDTHLANNRDRLLHGTYQRGAKHPMAVISEAAVRSVRERGLHYTEIMRELGISRSQAHRIAHGKSWTHITKEAA